MIWFATGGRGTSRYDDRGMGDSPHFVDFTTKSGLAYNHVHAVYCEPDGAVWLRRQQLRNHYVSMLVCVGEYYGIFKARYLIWILLSLPKEIQEHLKPYFESGFK